MASIKVMGGIDFELIEQEELPSIDVEPKLSVSDAHAIQIERQRATAGRGPDLTDSIATLEFLIFGHRRKAP